MATTYTIKKGDTLSKIAKRMGTTVAELAELNGIANVNKIRAGATIKLPTEAPIPAARTRALDVARTRYAYPTDPSVADNGTIAGSKLTRVRVNSGSGAVAAGGVLTGTWTNISGATVNGTNTNTNGGYWVRTA